MDNEQNNTPYQGAYTGEQIDQAIQKALEPHVEKFNGRTGTVLPQKGDYKAEQIDLDPVSGLTADNLQEAVTELFTSVSEGKSLIASAVTDKGIPTEADAPFETMRDNILAIETGGGLPEDLRAITVTADPPEGGTVSGGGVASDGMTVTVKAMATDGYGFLSWKESGEEVSQSAEYSFTTSVNRRLMAEFETRRLPSGYTEIKYLESTGAQYIDTGVLPNDHTWIYVDAQILETENSKKLFGVHEEMEDGSIYRYALGFTMSSMFANFDVGQKDVNISKGTAIKQRMIFSISDGKVAAGDKESPLTTGTFQIHYPVYLFWSYVSWNTALPVRGIAAKIFSCQFYDDEKQIRDFVPCKNESGEAGFYELIGKSFYGNSGTGAFIAGPAV